LLCRENSVFPSPTKIDVKVIGLNGLRKMVKKVKIPVVAM
jgi:thiamine-phosphate pyrophosphorylase